MILTILFVVAVGSCKTANSGQKHAQMRSVDGADSDSVKSDGISGPYELVDGHYEVKFEGQAEPKNVRELHGVPAKTANLTVSPDGAVTLDVGFDFSPFAGSGIAFTQGSLATIDPNQQPKTDVNQVSSTEQQKTVTADSEAPVADFGSKTLIRKVTTWSRYHNGPIFSDKWGSDPFSSSMVSISLTGDGVSYVKTFTINHSKEILRLNFKRK
jgi:hypothetical protein